jgi:hypothetical protein
MRFFASDFFHESSFSKPLKIRLGSFQTFSKNSARDIRKSRYTTGINDTDGEFATGIVYTGGKFAQVSTTLVANLQRRAVHKQVPQIPQICVFTKFVKFANLPQVWHLWICDLRTQYFLRYGLQIFMQT